MKNWFKKYLWIVQLVTLMVGCILALLAGFYSQNKWGLSLLSVGIAFISTGLLAVLNKLFGTDVSSIVEQTLDFEKKIVGTGLEEVHLDKLDNYSIIKKFNNARHIDMLFNTGANFFNLYSETIKNAINNGCHIRLLISDPGNKYWHNNEITDGLCPTTNIQSQIRDVFKELQKILDELSKLKPKGALEIRTYSCISTNSMIIIDDFIRYSPYLPYLNSANIPSYDVSKERGGELYTRYKQAFENIWKHNNTKSIIEIESGKNITGSIDNLSIKTKDNEFDSYKLLNAATIQGLEMIYQNRKEAMDVFVKFIQGEKEEVVMIGSSLLGLKTIFDFDLLFSTNPNIFKILLINPYYIKTRAASANRNETGIKIEIEETVNKLINLNIPKENIKLFNGTPTVFMIKTTEHMLINPYTYSSESYNCICLQVNSNGSIFQHFDEYHYKRIWNSSCCANIDVLGKNFKKEEFPYSNLSLEEVAPIKEDQ